MRGWIIGVCALIGASAARAEGEREPYAQVGKWDIAADAAKRICLMSRMYGSVDPDKVEGIMVLYNAQKQAASISWASKKIGFLPKEEGTLDFDLSFLKGSSLDESWGRKAFDYKKVADKYIFTHVFLGAADAKRILRDIAEHESITLFFGPSVLTGLPLDASEAVEKLRECSLKLADGVPPSASPQ